MKRVSLEELFGKHPLDSYQQQYARIRELLEKGKLKPVRAAGTNGKSPALCLSYWVAEEENGLRDELAKELNYRLEPVISIGYYLSHLDE